jgi:hypothetical protein
VEIEVVAQEFAKVEASLLCPGTPNEFSSSFRGNRILIVEEPAKCADGAPDHLVLGNPQINDPRSTGLDDLLYINAVVV